MSVWVDDDDDEDARPRTHSRSHSRTARFLIEDKTGELVIMKKNHIHEAFRDIIAGTVGGIAQTISGHPMDIIKVRLQTQSSAGPIFRGTIDCILKNWRLEGLVGFYKGAAAPLAGALAQNACIFGLYGAASRHFEVDEHRVLDAAGSSRRDLWKVSQASAITGFCLAFIESPIELVKCKLQAQVGPSLNENFTQRGVRLLISIVNMLLQRI